MNRILATIGLLLLSNIFMTAAWYGHLKWFPSQHKTLAMLIIVILFSWALALPEYCLQVPGNRLGHVLSGGPFTTPQLKIIQEAITLIVFAVFSIFVLGDKFHMSDIVGFILIFAGVAVSMLGRGSINPPTIAPTPLVSFR